MPPRRASRLLLEIDVGQRLAGGVPDDEAPPIQLGVGLVDGPGRREAGLLKHARHLVRPPGNRRQAATPEALLLEIAGGWQETTRRSRRRLLQAFSFVSGVIILAVLMYREGWEAGLFMLIFLAIWQLATIETVRDF